MWTMSSGRSSQISFTAYCSNIMGTFVFIIGIASIAYAANIMENMITKEKRIAFSDASGDYDREICSTIFNCYGRDGRSHYSCGFIGRDYALSCTSFV